MRFPGPPCLPFGMALAFSEFALRRALLLAVLAPGSLVAQDLQMAHLGECRLESGARLPDCRLGYRTLGTPASDGSNVILLPSWFLGNSEEVLGFAVSRGFVDPDVHFVVAVDAFGNGVSSSPSNTDVAPLFAGDTTGTKPGAFPPVAIRDMVRAQQRLIMEILGIPRIHGVLGFSMGGHQAFEWVTTFPGSVDRAVAIVGSPRSSPADRLLYSGALAGLLSGCAPDRCDAAWEAFLSTFAVLLRTPEYLDRTLAPGEVADYLSRFRAAWRRVEPADVLSQLAALAAHDVAGPFGGALSGAAEVVEAELLLVVATHDRMVAPGASREFARLTGARFLEMANDCGHQAFVCQGEELGPMVRAFLRR